MIPRARRAAAASAGAVLVLLTVFFYGPILSDGRSRRRFGVEGVNYVGDTLLFAATALLAGFSIDLEAPLIVMKPR